MPPVRPGPALCRASEGERGLISETDIEAAFQHLLGRAASASEITTLRAHFNLTAVDQTQILHESLLRSEEFRNRRLAIYRRVQFHPLQLDRKRLVFVHIEKCGGTTLRAMLETHFDPARICPERLDGIGNWTINELAAYDLFCGHFDLAHTRSIPGDVRTITMLREPKARLVSLFRFWKSHLPNPDRDTHNLMALARNHDIEDFFCHPFVMSHPSIRDAMAGQLIRTGGKLAVDSGNILVADPAAALQRAWSHLRGMTMFGIMERFEASRILLNKTLGLTMETTRPRQVLSERAATEQDMVEIPATPMTTRLDLLLDALTVVDRPLYAQAQKLFERRMGLASRVRKHLFSEEKKQKTFISWRF